LALFGNLVYRHVFTQSDYWEGVTRVGETNNKKYNLSWSASRTPVSPEKIDEFFVQIMEEKEKREKRADSDTGVSRKAKNPVKIQPEMLVNWWNSRLELSESEECSMKMREIWLKFTKETGIHISLALFGELSVRYVMRSNPNFAGVVRTRGIHDKKYSLRWKPLNPQTAAAATTSTTSTSATTAATATTTTTTTTALPMYHQHHHSPRAGSAGAPLSPPRSPRVPLAHAAAGGGSHPHIAPPASPPPARQQHPQLQYAQYGVSAAAVQHPYHHHYHHHHHHHHQPHHRQVLQQQQHAAQHHAHLHHHPAQHAAPHVSYAAAMQQPFEEEQSRAVDDDGGAFEVEDGFAQIGSAAYAPSAPAAAVAPVSAYQYPQFTLFGSRMDGLANSFSTVSIAS
jgi:hypothetical protein